MVKNISIDNYKTRELVITTEGNVVVIYTAMTGPDEVYTKQAKGTLSNKLMEDIDNELKIIIKQAERDV
jgi:D-aminopeptidase